MGWCNEPSSQCTCFTNHIAGTRCDECMGTFIGPRCDSEGIYSASLFNEDFDVNCERERPLRDGGGRGGRIRSDRKEEDGEEEVEMSEEVKRMLPGGCQPRRPRLQQISLRMTPTKHINKDFSCTITNAEGSFAGSTIINPMRHCAIEEVSGFWVVRCSFIRSTMITIRDHKGNIVDVGWNGSDDFFFEVDAKCVYHK